MTVASVEALWNRAWMWLRTERAERLLRLLVVTGSLLFVGLFLWSALRRMRYPYDLEWIESGIRVSVARIVHGQPLYAPPSFNYVPYLYAPLYFYVCALFTRLAPSGFVAERLVSTLSALATQVLLCWFVRKESRSWLAGIAAAGIYASLYLYIGGWVDVGRVDALFLFLFLLGLYCTRFAPPVVAAAVWVLAFQTKQTMLPAAVPFLLTYWDRRRPSRLVVALGSYAAMALASIAWMDHISGGWYRYYVFGTLHGLPAVARLAALYFSEILLRPLSIVFLVIGAVLLLAPPELRSRRTVFYAIGSAVLYPGFWYVRAHRGYGNTMEAVYLWSLLLFGMALARLLRLAREQGAPASRAQALVNVVLLGVVAQLGSQLYNPGQFVPSAEDRAVRDALETDLREIPGDVYVMNHSWDAVLAGKKPYAEGEAVGAVIDTGGPQRAEIIAAVQQATMNHQLAAIVVDGGYQDYREWLTPQEVAEYPVHVPAPGADEPRFLTSQPVMILLPCTALQNGLAAKLAPDHAPASPPECRGK